MLSTVDPERGHRGRSQPFDNFAALGAFALDGAAIAIVELTPVPTVLGCSAKSIPPFAVTVAARVPPVEPALLARLAGPIAGTPLPFVPPFARVVNLAMSFGTRQMICMVFPRLPGIAPQRLAEFAVLGQRKLADSAITHRYRSDLKRYISMFAHIEKTAKVGLWEYDFTTRELFWSDELFRIHERAPGRPPPPDAALEHFPEPGRTRLKDLLNETRLTGAPGEATLPFVTEQGAERVVRIIATLQSGPDGSERLNGVVQDVTAAQEATERLWWAANHDALTALPNRTLFADRFRNALERMKRTGKLVCLVLIDVDNFKDINDGLGHAAGDELLRLVAKRLNDNVRSHDTVARTGGDEFSILIEDIDSPEALDAVMRRLRNALDVRLVWEEHTTLVTLSAGAAIAPRHGTTERDLTLAADLALYRMKEEPTSALALYEPAFGRAREERSRLLVAVRGALEQGRIVPFYQPQVDIASGRIVGVEALARWVRPDRVLPAGDFAVALADHELGPQIGRAVVDRAIAEIAELNAARERKIALSINASAGELLRDTFLERIGSICKERDPGAGPITVEINEQVMLDDPDGTLREHLRTASENGVSFSLDDFGMGYASLVRISTLPISEVKVDRRVIVGLEEDRSKQKIIRGIIDVARTLNLKVIVEGVETVAQVKCLTALGCRFAQGFVYSRAVPLDELKGLLDGERQAEDAPARARQST